MRLLKYNDDFPILAEEDDVLVDFVDINTPDVVPYHWVGKYWMKGK